MYRIRLRREGFDARPHRPSSLRAEAQRKYRTYAVERRRGRGQAADHDAARGAEQLTELTQQVRALYEDTVVPVAELARIVGVSERTLYKYAAKGGWERRRATQDIESAVRKRAARRKPRPCVTAKGAGGRFIGAVDAGAPVRRGLKALDPEGEARALAIATEAAALADEAVARTQRLRETMTNVQMLKILVEVARNLAVIKETGEREAQQAPGGEKAKPPRRRHPWPSPRTWER